jgi:hypothetical protein
MTDELKSAWELAMERLGMSDQPGADKLSPEQKSQIAEGRGKFKAKIAEAEIRTEGLIREAVGAGDYETIGKLRQELVDDRNRFNQEVEAEVAKIRERTS